MGVKPVVGHESSSTELENHRGVATGTGIRRSGSDDRRTDANNQNESGF